MKKIDYLPKFYEKEDIKARQKALVELRKELIATGKLNASEIEEINDFDITLCADAFSRNYVINRTNELADFVKYR